jgi:hypothetical protein
MSHDAYLVIEPGAQSAQLNAAARTFAAADLGSLFAQVDRAARRDSAFGRAPSAVHLELGSDTGGAALEARSRLLGTIADTMVHGGHVTLSAPAGRPFLMASALADWFRASLLGTPLRIDVLLRGDFAQAA